MIGYSFKELFQGTQILWISAVQGKMDLYLVASDFFCYGNDSYHWNGSDSRFARRISAIDTDLAKSPVTIKLGNIEYFFKSNWTFYCFLGGLCRTGTHCIPVVAKPFEIVSKHPGANQCIGTEVIQGFLRDSVMCKFQ